MPNMNIKVSEVVAPMYKATLKQILNHDFTHYIFKGGRGSTKSSL